jgi:class 3 adenylate cyclase
MVTCPKCGTLNPEAFRFCGNCAAPLAAQPAPAGERRKVVSVVFADVAGSTSLGERLDPEAMRAVMTRYFEVLRRVLEKHGGTVEKFIGDAVMAVFGHPVLHEDDALRAVRAAAEMRDELVRLNEQLALEWGVRIDARIGVNTGQVVAGEPGSGETLVTGDPVNVAARLEAAAPAGEILIGAETHRLVRDAVVATEVEPLSLKGKELPVAAWRLESVVADAAGHARHVDSPLVGRQRELRLLHGAFERVVNDNGSVLFTLLGTAGVGKSRLVYEFLGQLGKDARVLRGRCLPYGEGITYWPLAEVVKAAAGIEETDAPDSAREKVVALVAEDPQATTVAGHVNGAIGLADEGGGEEIFWAVRRLLERLASARPLVVVFDDVHWAEPTFLDLLDHIADWSRDAPILLLCIARPELLEARPTWGGGKLNATTLSLQAMGVEEVDKLVDNLLGEGTLSPAVIERVREASEGNPLFVEEFVAMLIDDGLVVRRDGEWSATGDLGQITVPTTIRSLLAARIDRLAAGERRVIERASVVGKVFWRSAVAELAPEKQRPETGPSLLGLVRKELVRPDSSDFAGDEAFRFRHLLLRDAAYDALPKQERAQLHQRFADWLERAAGERLAEYEEVIGYHLEQAYRYRTELGQIDDDARRVAARAAGLLAAAGGRANDRGDTMAARKLLGRAVALFGPADDGRPNALFHLGRAEIESGELLAAEAHFEEAAAGATALGDVSLTWLARLERMRCRVLRAEEGAGPERMAVLRDALVALSRSNDERALALASYHLHEATFFAGDMDGARAAAEDVVGHARRAGDEGLELEGLLEAAALSVFDRSPIERGLANAELGGERARALGRRLSEARAQGIFGRLVAMRGDPDRGRALVEEAIRVLRELGRRMHAAAALHWLWTVGWCADDPAAMEEAMRVSVRELDEGEKGFLATSRALLATALARQGKFAEARLESDRAAAETAAYDADGQLHWRMGKALALAGLGEADAAAGLADEALTHIDAGAAPVEGAVALYELGSRAYRGQPDKAIAALRRSRDLFEGKGASAIVERIDRRLAELDGQGAGEAAAAEA